MTTQPEVSIISDPNVGAEIHGALCLVERAVIKAKGIAAIPEINGGTAPDAWLHQAIADIELYATLARELWARKEEEAYASSI